MTLTHVQFWALVEELNGEVSDDSLKLLRKGLTQLPVKDVRAFQKRLESALTKLCKIDLVEAPTGYRPLGDGALALRLAVIAAGEGEFNRVLGASGTAATTVESCCALELREIAKLAYEDLTDEAWPEVNWTELALKIGTVQAQLNPVHADLPFLAAVDAALARLASDEGYARSAIDAGFVYVDYSGWLVPLILPWARKGPRQWRARLSKNALLIHFELDPRDFPRLTAAAGTQFVRNMVDDVARSHRLLPSEDIGFE